jgi:hypothetical protein
MVNVSIAIDHSEQWYNYNFKKINNNYFNKKKYNFCHYNGGSTDSYFLTKLQIYGKKNQIFFDHLRFNKKKSDIVIFINLYRLSPLYKKVLITKKIFFLIITEPRVVDPFSYNHKYHKFFKKIFTFDDKLIKKNGTLYSYWNGKTWMLKEFKKIYKKKKSFLSCIFAANRHWLHKDSLSSVRYSIIQWFINNKPNDLRLFGSNWNFDYFKIMSVKNYFIRKALIYLMKFRIFNYFFFKKNLKIYRGEVIDKVKTASFFKFEFCCENAKNKGRLSERIFQSFFSGTVPIYIGDETIKKYIPKNCYIDFWKFKNLEQLHKHLQNMKINTYKKYLKNAEIFIKSKEYFKHTVDYNAINIIKEINYLRNN